MKDLESVLLLISILWIASTIIVLICFTIIFSLLNKTIMTQQELQQKLEDLLNQNEKARVEILAKIKALEDEINVGGGVSEGVQAALDALKASIQTDDEIVPDAPPV